VPKHSIKKIWKNGKKAEIEFWDAFFKHKGLIWPEDFNYRLSPCSELQERPAALLKGSEDKILDVGAGPLTYLGKRSNGRLLNIAAIDPLADEYDKILAKHNIRPYIRTERLATEEPSRRYKAESFDLVFARNCLDHSYNPIVAIYQMLKVLKRGGYLLFEHKPNEAENQRYRGLHQWNFSLNIKAELLIGSKSNTTNINRMYSKYCRINSEIIFEESEGYLIINRIHKG